MDLPVREFSASGYRSLERIAYPVSRLDVFVGANGAGKSNLSRGLELLRAAAANTLGVTLRNSSGGAVDGAARTWTWCLIRAPRFNVI